jgi:hypothetical protein
MGRIAKQYSPFMFMCLFLGCSDAETREWTQQADAETEIVVILAPETQVVERDQPPRFTATLVNRGKLKVTLVEPGDGSDCGWRTPLIPGRGVKEVFVAEISTPSRTTKCLRLDPENRMFLATG